ncbi:MAG: hypothetical protein RIR18_1172 [Pseudomonadota bacterium]|jgi:gp16 family phage-associated protein
MKQKELKTREAVVAEFARKGISIRGWAIKNGVDPSIANAVLKGRLTGRIGESHKAAVLLGLKYGEIVGDNDNE